MRNRMMAATILATLAAGPALAQDVPGIEICTVEKTMERRTSCLQSNVNFLQTSLGKQGREQQQKLDAATRQIEVLRMTLAGLQKTVEELQAAQKKPAAAPAATPAAPAAKDAPKDATAK
jgi:hypothetical protein